MNRQQRRAATQRAIRIQQRRIKYPAFDGNIREHRRLTEEGLLTEAHDLLERMTAFYGPGFIRGEKLRAGWSR